LLIVIFVFVNFWIFLLVEPFLPTKTAILSFGKKVQPKEKSKN
jgi:hypothetical protein